MMQVDGWIATDIGAGKFDGVVLKDAGGGFDIILSMLVNSIIYCADISIFK